MTEFSTQLLKCVLHKDIQQPKKVCELSELMGIK